MLTREIRKQFIDFFKKQGHAHISSAPVAPLNDPSLLFNNAGMNQFKDVFLGKTRRDYTRAATSQKCIRVGGKHNDFENVGHTSRHLTFFEMLGNFSFGDYFKKEAIDFAWTLSTEIWQIDDKKIWASVYEKDDEALELWLKYLPKDRIVKLGEKDNFWAMGDVGPCGPCSELLFDRGAEFGKATSPAGDTEGERFFEFWNLVFMQYSKDAAGVLSPLPHRCIDTGAGLERVAALKAGVDTLFLTDILRSLIAETENICGKKYAANTPIAPAFHVIADHIRSLSFSIADGVVPSNTDRGYILRKLIRRAVRYGKSLGIEKPFLAELLPRLNQEMGEDFPELINSHARTAELLTEEEEAFHRTLQRGGNLLSNIIESSKKTIRGEDAFKLKDTYGFPLEEILLIAKDANLGVDLATYNKLEEEARQKSKQAQKDTSQHFETNFFEDFSKAHAPYHFCGYEQHSSDARIIGIVVEGEFMDAISEGQEGCLILDRTPFYSEMGGQMGDSGFISCEKSKFTVDACRSPYSGVALHIGMAQTGGFKVGDAVNASIDHQKRKRISNNHTATHLLQWALTQVLGAHIKQTGSLVDDCHLRFDFSHHKALSKDELRLVEDKVNEKIRENRLVATYELKYEKAQKDPAIRQFFGDKYGSTVRVVDIDFSKELCGGTHVARLGDIGFFKIEKESSIAAGIRRIEALTGNSAEKKARQEEDLIESLSITLKTTPAKISERLHSFIEENRNMAAELKQFKSEGKKELAIRLLANVQTKNNVKLLIAEVALDAEELMPFAKELSDRMGSGLVALGSKNCDRCQITINVGTDLIARGIYANSLIKEIAPIIEGGGGGKKENATAGGKNPGKLTEALKKLETLC